jgi:putative ABC transport system ATP-binding protein
VSHALRLLGIHKRYRAGLGACHGSVDALRGVTLTVETGEVVVVTGRAGSGKSTLLMCAAGLLRPDRGRVHWFGERATPAGRPPGVIYRSAPTHYGCMTVAEALAHAMVRREITPHPSAMGLALERVGMGAASSVRVSRLGAGQLRRLALAEMVLAPPRIALLDGVADEPDAGSVCDVPAIIAWLAATGVTLVVSAANARPLAAIASRVVTLDEGRLRALSTPLPRALELTVDHAPRAASRLGRTRAARSAGPTTVRIALGGASAEEVLADCRRLGIAVHASRVVLLGSLSRARVAEERSSLR